MRLSILQNDFMVDKVLQYFILHGDNLSEDGSNEQLAMSFEKYELRLEIRNSFKKYFSNLIIQLVL